MRRLYLATHAANLKRFRVLETLADAFRSAGIRLTLLKGAALVLRYGEPFGLRPMSDLDILIPPGTRSTAMEVLETLGWKPSPRDPRRLSDSFYDTVHAWDFTHPDGHTIDLHWHVLHECLHPEADREFSRAAVPVAFRGRDFLVLCPADQLLHVLLQGARCAGIAYLRWVTDAAMVLAGSGTGLDWDRFLRLTARFRLAPPVTDALNYLDRRMGSPVPRTVLARSNAMPCTSLETLEYRYKRSRLGNSSLNFLPMIWFDFLRVPDPRGLAGKLAGFPGHIFRHWGARTPGEFLSMARTILFLTLRPFPGYRSGTGPGSGTTRAPGRDATGGTTTTLGGER
jgi:hypothetical protein